MTKIVLDDHLSNQTSIIVEPLTESVMILSKSVSTALNQTLTRVNNSLEATTTVLNSEKNIIGQQTQKLEDHQNKIHEYSIVLKRNTRKKNNKNL